MFFTKWIEFDKAHPILNTYLCFAITVILINLLSFLFLRGLGKIFKLPHIRSAEEIRTQALIRSLASIPVGNLQLVDFRQPQQDLPLQEYYDEPSNHIKSDFIDSEFINNHFEDAPAFVKNILGEDSLSPENNKDMKEYLTKFGLLIKIGNDRIDISDLELMSFPKSMEWDYGTQRMKTDNRSGGLKYGFLKNLFIKETFQKNYLKFFYNEENLNNLNKILQDIIKLINNPMNINDQVFFENPNNFYFLNSGDCWNAIFDKDTCTIKNLTDEEKIDILKKHEEILKKELPTNLKDSSIYIFLNHFLNIDYLSSDYKKTIDSFNLNDYENLLDKTEKSFKEATTPDEKEAIKEDLKKIEEIKEEFNKKNELDKNEIENIFYFKWKLNYVIKQINIKHKTTVVFPDTNSCDLNFYLFLEALNNNEDFKLATVDTNNFLKQLIYLYLTISKFGDNYKSNNSSQNQSVERLVNSILEEQRRREQRRREAERFFINIHLRINR